MSTERARIYLRRLAPNASIEEVARAYADVAMVALEEIPKIKDEIDKLHSAVITYSAVAQRAENAALRAEQASGEALNAAHQALEAAREAKTAAMSLAVQYTKLKEETIKEIAPQVNEFAEEVITENIRHARIPSDRVKPLVERALSQHNLEKEAEEWRRIKNTGKNAVLEGIKKGLALAITAGIGFALHWIMSGGH